MTQSEINTRLSTEEDFSHEMRVGDILRNWKPPALPEFPAICSEPQHGGTYKDPVTEKLRQFDYRHWIHASSGVLAIALAIECKNVKKETPVVIQGRPRTDGESYHVYHTYDISQPREKMVMGAFYKPQNFVGKSILQLNKGSSKDTEIYDRWSQAVSSCYDLVYHGWNTHFGQGAKSFICPIVVLPNDTLWIETYQDDGSPSNNPQKVEQCEFYLGTEIHIPVQVYYKVSHIHFVTLTGLKSLLKDFIDNPAVWKAIFNLAEA